MPGKTYRVISKAELLTLLQKDAPCPIQVTQTSCVHRDVSERSRIPNYHLELLIHRYLPALNDRNTVVVLDEEALSIWLDDFGRVTAEIQVSGGSWRRSHTHHLINNLKNHFSAITRKEKSSTDTLGRMSFVKLDKGQYHFYTSSNVPDYIGEVTISFWPPIKEDEKIGDEGILEDTPAGQLTGTA